MSPTKPIDPQKLLQRVRESFDQELQTGSNGESFYSSVLMCKERGTSLCKKCKRVATFLKSHARTSKHYYCTVPRCGEVKVHKVMDLTELREEMQLMTIAKGEEDVKSAEAEARMS